MTIPERLKIARKMIGFSQEAAAVRTGLNQKDISQLENGGRKFIPNEYIQFLQNEGIDIGTIWDDTKNVALKMHVAPPSPTILYDEPATYTHVPPGLKASNKKNIAPPTAPPTPEIGVTAMYLTPQVITVDNAGNENILHVSIKAAAGYLRGFGDAEYMGTLPSFRLPGLANGTYRSFEVAGDSMYPTLKNGQMVIGRWVEKLDYIRDDRVHILITKTQGIIIKRLLNRILRDNSIICKSDATDDREMYKNITVHPDDVQEIWYGVFNGGFDFKSPSDLWKRVNNHEADITILMDAAKAAGLIPK